MRNAQKIHTRPDREIPRQGARRTTLSLGVATTDQTEALGQEALLQAADQAVYRAKEEGRNRAAAAPSEDFRFDRMAV